jgi:hypothetical protein
MKSAFDELRAVLGEAGKTTTGNVLMLPSGPDNKLAQQSIEKLSMDQMMHEIGVIAARTIADDLMTQRLRPSDYSSLPDVDRLVAAKICKELETVPAAFSKALADHMKLRG